MTPEEISYIRSRVERELSGAEGTALFLSESGGLRLEFVGRFAVRVEFTSIEATLRTAAGEVELFDLSRDWDAVYDPYRGLAMGLSRAAQFGRIYAGSPAPQGEPQPMALEFVREAIRKLTK